MSAALPAPGLAQTATAILQALRGVIAARMHRPQTVRQRAAFPVLMLLWHYLGRTANRFAALAARAAAGAPPRRPLRTEARSRPDGSPPDGAPPDPARPVRPPDPLPRGTAWVVRLLGWEAAAYGSQLNHFLAQPEMAALLQTWPQAACLFRPICRMLGYPLPPRPKPAVRAALPPEPPTVAATPHGAEPEPHEVRVERSAEALRSDDTPAPPDTKIAP